MDILEFASDDIKKDFVFLRNCELFLPNGWTSTFLDFCEKVQNICQDYRKKGFVVFCKIRYVKEKWGGLKIGWEHTGQVKYNYNNSISAICNNGDDCNNNSGVLSIVAKKESKELQTKLTKLSGECENKCAVICQWCNGKGKLYVCPNTSWYQTICNACMTKQNAV